MDIRILGTGCQKCKTLEANVQDVVKEMDIKADVIKVTEIDKIMEYDVIMTPALVVNGKVKASGRVPGKDEIKKLIQSEL